jgi:hypothetical protein
VGGGMLSAREGSSGCGYPAESGARSANTSSACATGETTDSLPRAALMATSSPNRSLIRRLRVSHSLSSNIASPTKRISRARGCVRSSSAPTALRNSGVARCSKAS